MSAWIVSKEHIDRLVTAGIKYGLVDAANANEFGQMLVDENVRSVSFRYPENREDLPGPIDRYYDAFPYVYVERVTTSKPEIAKGVDCYDYQSCEHDGWKVSKAKAFCDALLDRLTVTEARYRSKAYEAAPWGWDE